LSLGPSLGPLEGYPSWTYLNLGPYRPSLLGLWLGGVACLEREGAPRAASG